jgi:acyl-CoA reductase-like NAD-dependent aldehyde dehydrogenase/nicotinamidase-related amidase
MNPLLLLVDLQNDYLAAPGLEPAAPEIVRGATRLLDGARLRGLRIAHVRTSIDPDADDRMPHWKARGRWMCVRGTPGESSPPALSERPGEEVLTKIFFSAFGSPRLEPLLSSTSTDTLFVAGVHLHGCVRATVLDAYERGLAVWIAEDAVGSDDPLHAAITRRYLEGRAARFASSEALLSLADGESRRRATLVLPVAKIGEREISADSDGPIHRSPRDGATLFAVPSAGAEVVREAVERAGLAGDAWRKLPGEERRSVLGRWADRLEAEADDLSRALAVEVGKPRAEGRQEVRRSAELLRSAPAAAVEPWTRGGPESFWRRVPVGVVAAVTPWNNPIAIPLGKIAPALSLGNAVVWKPAPAASRMALRVLEIGRETGLPAGLVNLVCGDHRAAARLLEQEAVGAVSLSGSSMAGWSAQEACARRRVPLQAELGGNNAAIVWEGADVPRAARAIARGAFSFAGQRCTANRRAVVFDRLFDSFLEALHRATADLCWGDPLDPATEVGPLISAEARDRVAAALDRARPDAELLLTPHAVAPPPNGDGFYLSPAIVVGARPDAEIVQEETFGPVLVVQRARDFEEALALGDGVRQGLVGALFAGEEPIAARFLEAARAGVLKRERATAGTDASAPFGGWKFSGLGPPERGPGDLEFFTRVQTLYGEPGIPGRG